MVGSCFDESAHYNWDQSMDCIYCYIIGSFGSTCLDMFVDSMHKYIVYSCVVAVAVVLRVYNCRVVFYIVILSPITNTHLVIILLD